jgi:hypothetical protein
MRDVRILPQAVMPNAYRCFNHARLTLAATLILAGSWLAF